MSTSPLTPYILSKALIDYTIAVTSEGLQSGDSASQQQAKKRAASALQFFLDILDPSIEEERQQLELFQSYRAALDDPSLASKIAQDLPKPAAGSTKSSDPSVFDLTPAQRVLSLPDTLETILAHIPLLSKSDRDTFHHATLTSHAFYNAAQLKLWRRPRDLDTVEQQVRFAFGTAISGAGGDSLGNYVKRLRIRIVKGGWNARLVERIAALSPGVADLTLHWGDSTDGAEPVTAPLVASLHKTLSSLPNLKYLYLAKFANTPESEDLQIPSDAHTPFTKLESLQLYDFHWYWEPISRGLGSSLKALDIGYGTLVAPEKIVELSAKLPSLSTLRLTSAGLEVRHIRSIVETLPKLERFDINTLNELDDEYVAAAIPLLAGLDQLKELSFNGAIGSTQLKVVTNSPGPLEDISLKLKGDSEVADNLEKLLLAKRQTLKKVKIQFDDDALAPSDKLVEALASIPHLRSILIDFARPQNLSSSSVEKLLKQCPELELTDNLEELLAGNALYEAEYKARLEKERDQAETALEEDILGN